jgi:protein dithiol oxidoreductase (disulfide-forming)
MRNVFALKLMLVLALVIPGVVVAEPAQPQFVEGKHYQILPFPVRTRDTQKIEVVELFWYGCPHCYRFDPLVKNWQKTLPEDVDFWMSPAVFGKDWQIHAQAFYAADVLGVLDKVHQPLFDTLARDRKPINTEADMVKFMGQQGVDADAFKKSYNSFGVRSKVEQATARARSYRATGVPAMVVNGKYRIDAGSAGSLEEMIRVVDYLVAKERAEKGS